MKSWEKWLIGGLIAAILGGFFLFVPPVTVINLGLGIGRHNDRVIVGTLVFLAGMVCFYKMLFKLKILK